MGLSGLPLPLSTDGEQVEVTSIIAGPDMRKRLGDLGVIPGKSLKVVQKAGGGMIVIAIGDTRLALDPSMARTVLVKPSDTRKDTGNEREAEATCRRGSCRRGGVR